MVDAPASTAAFAATARDLEAELGWFVGLLDARFHAYFEAGAAAAAAAEPPAAPDLSGGATHYARFVGGLDLDPDERLALVLALVPHLRPRILDVFHTRNTTFDRRFTEFGGTRTGSDGDFQPTPETLAFILGGDSLEARLRVAALIEPQRTLARRDVVRAIPALADDPMKAALRVGPEALAAMLFGEVPAPAFGTRFPAQRLETALEWDDLVLHPGTRAQVAEIEAWIRHGPTLMEEWGMGRVLRPGYRCLFYGPPGTGKTMTATLIGKATGRPIYRIDLSMVVSKYIGETEKNLARVFDGAQSRGWILFFDEADALFGKRGETKDAHDRYANQEVSFLLQRIETFDGIAILASNLRDNIDAAFARRFESIVHFPVPRPEEREALWRGALPLRATLGDDVDLAELAREHVLTGGAIINAVRFAALAALNEGGRAIGRRHLVTAIRREYGKEGRLA